MRSAADVSVTGAGATRNGVRKECLARRFPVVGWRTVHSAMEARARAKQQTYVQVHCSNDHDTTLGIEDVAIVHANGTVVGYRFRCPRCSTPNEVSATADTLAVLHAFGVTALEKASGPGPFPVAAQREVVSLRVLLDHPEVAAALFAPAAETVVEQESGSPSS